MIPAAMAAGRMSSSTIIEPSRGCLPPNLDDGNRKSASLASPAATGGWNWLFLLYGRTARLRSALRNSAATVSCNAEFGLFRCGGGVRPYDRGYAAAPIRWRGLLERGASLCG